MWLCNGASVQPDGAAPHEVLSGWQPNPDSVLLSNDVDCRAQLPWPDDTLE